MYFVPVMHIYNLQTFHFKTGLPVKIGKWIKIPKNCDIAACQV